MFDPMLEACPSFRPVWEAFCDEAADHEPRPYYWALGDLAHHLVNHYKSGETDEFDAVFAVVERWHLEGEHYVKEAATIGLLEGLQNVSGNNDLDPDVFVTWLGPQSKKWWAELDAFWERVFEEQASRPSPTSLNDGDQ